MIEAAPSTAWYVYAVVGPANEKLRRALDGAGGLGGGPLALVEAHGLTAIVGGVPLAEFGADVLPERLNDRTWLEQNARAHEEVLQRVAGSTAAVVPLRFGSIHSERAEIGTLLEERRAAFEGALAHVRGRVELGVKVWLETPGAAGPAGAPSGRAYLEQKREERRQEDRDAAELQHVLQEIHDRLAGLAVDAVLNRPQPRELTGRQERMVLNAAYLVPADEETFVAAVSDLDARHRARGLSLELTGPWPPHNFVDLDERRI